MYRTVMHQLLPVWHQQIGKMDTIDHVAKLFHKMNVRRNYFTELTILSSVSQSDDTLCIVAPTDQALHILPAWRLRGQPGPTFGGIAPDHKALWCCHVAPCNQALLIWQC